MLDGGQIAGWENVVYYEYQNVRVIRTSDWKYIERFRAEPNELYDLEHDPAERNNLVDQPPHRATQEELRRRLRAFFNRYADRKYDLWRGGKAKTALEISRFRGR